MSLDSSFWIDAPASPVDLRTTLLAAGLGWEGLDDIRALKRLATSATILTIGKPFRLKGDALDEAGIAPTLQLFFANADKERLRDWTLDTLRAVLVLLGAFPGDALLLYSGDSPALLRRRGALTLDSRCGLWQPDVEPAVLPLVDLPYAFGIIPVT